MEIIDHPVKCGQVDRLHNAHVIERNVQALLGEAFELALDREFRAVIQNAKKMASKIEQPADLWNLEHYLTRSRKKIDRTYDYRYSVLTDVFGRLIRENAFDYPLTNEEIAG